MATKQPRRSIPHSQPQPEGENVLPQGDGGLPSPRSTFSRPPNLERPVEPDPSRSRTPESHAKKMGTYKKALGKWESRQAQTKKNTAKRRAWEKSPVGQARTQDASAAFAHPETGTELPLGLLYHLKGWTDADESGPRVWDRQLPGMSDPHAAPRPPLFEELSAETQAHTHAGLKRYGTSLEKMIADIGAQIDQAYGRADRHRPNVREGERIDAIDRGETPPDTGVHPYARNFYSHGEPRQVIDRSARELGLPQSVHAVLNSLTSPNTVFEQKDGATGEARYPNNEAAMHAARHAMSGRSWEELTNENLERGDGSKHQGYTRNMQKAAKVTEQHLAGQHPSTWTGLPSEKYPEGKPIWGPKTGPYANSWSDSHPQFGVADIHTGGGGLLPHLGTEKPVLLDKEGNPRLDDNDKPQRDDSEREKAIEAIPFFHSAADYALRQAMKQRNLSSLRSSQAAEWGEEKIQRKEAGTLNSAPTEEEAYGRSATFHASRKPQEETLF